MSADALDALALQADAGGAAPEGAAPGAPPPPPAESPNLAALCMGFAVLREGMCFLLKVESPHKTLADDQIEPLARAIAPVLDKYGINISSALDAPEWKAALVGGPILWRVWDQLDMELKAKRAKTVDGAPAEGG